MSLSSNRLKETRAPSITQLWNERIRVERYFEIRNHEDGYDIALGILLFEDFTTADGAPPSPAESWTKEVRENRAFTNARLIDQRTRPPAGGDISEPVLVKTYETLTGTLVDEIKDATGQSENGLDFRTRTLIGLPTATFTGQTGTTPHPTVASLILNTYEVENTDAYRRVVARYLEPGVLSESEDFVGSQKAIIKTAFITVPSTPSGYSLARTEKSNVEGYETLSYTFLKPSVLSRSEDKVGSQLAITIEAFNQTPATPSGYSLARSQVSDFEGIPTRTFTFLKDNVELSRSEDYVGSQLGITTQVFNPAAAPTIVGYTLARKQDSDVDGIPTTVYTFLKDDVKLSSSLDSVGSQKAIVEEWFKPAALSNRDTKADYSLARTEVSDFEGIPTERYTFLKDNVELSRSEDYVGSQLGITTQVFKPSAAPTIAGYSLARKQDSDVEGIITTAFTFLKDNTILSNSFDNVGSQKAEVIQVFNPTADPTPANGGDLARKESSDVDGIITTRFTFLKPGRLSINTQSGPAPGTNRVTITYFKTDSGDAITGILESKSEQDLGGIKTIQETKVTGAIDSGSKVTFQITLQVVTQGSIEGRLRQISIQTPFSYTYFREKDGTENIYDVRVTDLINTYEAGQIPYLSTLGATRKKITANVEQYLATAPLVETPTAYQFNDFGVSVTEITYTRNFNSISSAVKNKFIPQVALVGSTEVTGRVFSHVENSPYAFTDRTLILEQKGSAPTTTGLYESRNQPSFRDANGNQYYLITRIVIP